VVDDVIIQSKFGFNILRDFRSTGGWIFHFPIDFVGHRYNSALLPCSLQLSYVGTRDLQCESKNPTQRFSDIFFENGWEFLDQILHIYYPFLSTMQYKFLSSYLQFWRSYAILSATIQFTPHVQNVHHLPKCMLAFSDIFPIQLGIFAPNFMHLFRVPIYARLQIFIQLSLTVTKLCHIKCDHPVCISTNGGHFKHILVVAHNMA